MLPSDQGFHAADVPAGEGHLGLIVEPEFPALHGMTQRVHKLQVPGGFPVLRRVVLRLAGEQTPETQEELGLLQGEFPQGQVPDAILRHP
jgi:hypothetical protein